MGAALLSKPDGLGTDAVVAQEVRARSADFQLCPPALRQALANPPIYRTIRGFLG